MAAQRNLRITTHQLDHSAALSALPPSLQRRFAGRFTLPDALDMVIGCGRQAIAPLLSIKANRPDIFTIYIQDPRRSTDGFDIVIAPEHDALGDANVIPMIGSPHRVSETRIIGETLNFANGLSALPMPRAAFLIGGTSKTHKLDADSHAAHLAAARDCLAAGYSLLITTSRRTPDAMAKDWALLASDHDAVWLYDGNGPNPYFAFLGGADVIFVTEDSTNMLVEACATGKPVHRLPMAGKPGKFAVLYDALETRCGVTRYVGDIGGKEYEPLEETARVAAALWGRIG